MVTEVEERDMRERIEIKPCLEVIPERYLNNFSGLSNDQLKRMHCLDPHAASVFSFVDLTDKAARLEIRLESCLHDYEDEVECNRDRDYIT